MNAEESKKLVAQEVERVFVKRGWKTFAQAEIATQIPVGTLQRLRKGLGKADTIERFGIAAGESPSVWKRIAVGLSPDGNDDDLAEAREERLNELERVPDEDTVFFIETFEGASPQSRELLRAIAEKVREMDSRHSIGGKGNKD